MPNPLDQTDRPYLTGRPNLTGRIVVVTGNSRSLGATIAAGLTAAM